MKKRKKERKDGERKGNRSKYFIVRTNTIASNEKEE